jgi:hypothetical protein
VLLLTVLCRVSLTFLFYSGSEYEKHTKCISEEEKYSGKNFKPKPNANKGEQKQEQWINVSANSLINQKSSASEWTNAKANFA